MAWGRRIIYLFFGETLVHILSGAPCSGRLGRELRFYETTATQGSTFG